MRRYPFMLDFISLRIITAHSPSKKRAGLDSGYSGDRVNPPSVLGWLNYKFSACCLRSCCSARPSVLPLL